MVISAALLRDVPSDPPVQTADECNNRILSYLYLCRRGARRFLRAGLEREDLEQVATIGLLKASRRYDKRLDTPFEAFAWLTILGELGHHVRDHEHLLRAPRHLRALEQRHRRAWERLALGLGREPSDRELVAELGLSLPELAELRVLRGRAQPIALDDPLAAHDIERTVRRSVAEDDDDALLRRAIRVLSRRERLIIYGLYWLNLSRSELGRRLDLSAKVVVRLHRAALRRLRQVFAEGSVGR